MPTLMGGIEYAYDGGKDFAFDALGENYELMQLTGLRDKNGREIYEGDLLRLVRVWRGKVTEDGIYQCEWNKQRTGFMLAESPGLFKYGAAHFEDCEIIGNIHENSDLLGGDAK